MQSNRRNSHPGLSHGDSDGGEGGNVTRNRQRSQDRNTPYSGDTIISRGGSDTGGNIVDCGGEGGNVTGRSSTSRYQPAEAIPPPSLGLTLPSLTPRQ